MLAVLVAVLGSMSVIHSAPLTCKDLIQPLYDPDSQRFQGRWALVAASLNHSAADDNLQGSGAVMMDVNMVSFTLSQSLGNRCLYFPYNISMEGHILTCKETVVTFTGTLFHTSCPDCVVVIWEATSPFYWTKDLYLFSRRRMVTQMEMDEFKAQVECLKMRPFIVMDPTTKPCPRMPEEYISAPRGNN